jgi:hypothetical protein
MTGGKTDIQGKEVSEGVGNSIAPQGEWIYDQKHRYQKPGIRTLKGSVAKKLA